MNRLERARDDRVLVGVCAGLARHLRIDADLVRVAFLLAAAADGMGWIVYAAAYLLVPEESGASASPVSRENGARKAGLLLVALAVLVHLAASGFDALFPWGWRRTWALLLPLLLLAAGALLIWPRLREAAGLAPGNRPRRSVSDRVIAGVAGGIGREAGIDPALVRLGLVAVTVVSWITVPLYVLLVLVLPEEEPTGAPAPEGPDPPSAAAETAPGPGQAPEEPDR
jgi:phage shock protein PspC (stress-responsive transcriptional regulator)